MFEKQNLHIQYRTKSEKLQNKNDEHLKKIKE